MDLKMKIELSPENTERLLQRIENKITDRKHRAEPHGAFLFHHSPFSGGGR